MSIWNPFAFTPTGQAVAPVAPPALRVMDGQATAQQLAHAQDAFYRFCASARLSAVPNPVETGRLPDGTRYRIVTVGAQTVMEIWPLNVTDSTELMHGVLRQVSEFAKPMAGGTRRVLEEFKANGETQYSDVTGFFVRPNYEYLETPIWLAFAKYDLSGPAAVLAQFGRGAVAAYNKYLGAKGAMPRSIGDGVFVVTAADGQKLFACYRIEAGDVKIVGMKGANLRVKGGLPSEISSLFGEAPLPPTNAEWAAAPIAVSYEEIRAASGFPFVALWSGLSFPKVASTGSGVEAYFIVASHEPIPPGGVLYKSRLMKLTFSVLPSGEFRAVVSAAGAPGNYDAFFATEAQIPDSGIWSAPFAVTHEGGVLTLFTMEHEFDSYSRPGTTPKKLIARKTLKWPRGEAHIHLEKTYSNVYASSWRRATAVLVGTKTETRETFPGYTMTTTSQKWVLVKSAAGSSDARADDRQFGSVQGLGREGTYYVTESTWKGDGVVVSGTFSGSYNPLTDEWYVVAMSETLYGTSYDRTAELAAAMAALNVDDSGELTFPDPKRKLYLGFFGGEASGELAGFDINEPTLPKPDYRFPNDRSFAIGAAMLSSYASIAVNWEDSSGSGELEVFQGKAVFKSAKLHANGSVYEIDAMGVMSLYDTPAMISQREKELNFAKAGPLGAIDNYRGGQMVVDLSQVGGPQVLLAFQGYSAVLGAQRTWKSTRGSLVGGTDDSNYTKTLSGKFVGVLQP